jgi:GTPase Era involved in 16S rRNA processing
MAFSPRLTFFHLPVTAFTPKANPACFDRGCKQTKNKHQNMKVSIMSVGRSGAGKSTVGNFFLNGSTSAMGNLFETSAGAESCTKGVNIRSSGERTYLDVPGMPDTSASETKGHYDTIVKTVKQEPISALLFVFKYEKIDEKAFQMAEILFRELKKADCLYLLLINDHNSYPFDPPPSEEEYAKLKEKIRHSTKIQFDHAWNATSVSLRKTVDEIHNYVQGLSFDSKRSPHLKDFDELCDHLDTLQTDADFQEDLEKEVKRQAARNMTVSNLKAAGSIGLGCGVLGASAVGGFGLAYLGGAVTAATGADAARIAGYNAGRSLVQIGGEACKMICQDSKERHQMVKNGLEEMKLQAARDAQAAIEDYKKAKQNFCELQAILDMNNSLQAHN